MATRSSKQKSKSTRNKTQRQLVADLHKHSPISEQYRTIRTNIEFSSVDKELRSFVVTSAGPGEGKSTSVANLAIVMAQNGQRVLIIDADMRRPTVHYTFSSPNTRGLTNVLSKQTTLEETVQITKIEHLSILTCGPIPPNPAELLNSRMMELVLEQALEQFDIIILDAPPVMAVTDAQLIASKVDGTILVTSSGKTDRDEVVKTKDLLLKSKANLLGVILNNKPVDEKSYYYY
ncbi:CpsD/CapB family tyrosine-protein kinase [Alkalicoccobacillus plakortidis]|uniref:non-specific protein-tyrosine kinase n=1 Tax=Alkalicoccobacillus plakortidis TaxID=444060 RepID=A0ABT0XJ69_9BACI|nr:CpsD/CapB family tyrosine-protein kinase [Alkalicoccobacillus plakortidis]MCM2675924.1 CpsD/CapB family tyrosine-protein kinase [Alkalicoccobacillus plakortidis]